MHHLPPQLDQRCMEMIENFKGGNLHMSYDAHTMEVVLFEVKDQLLCWSNHGGNTGTENVDIPVSDI